MNEYTDRTKWSDEQLVAAFAWQSCASRGVQDVIVKEKQRAALLARMRPEAGQKDGDIYGYRIKINDGFVEWKYELDGSHKYSIQDLIDIITDNAELHEVVSPVAQPAPDATEITRTQKEFYGEFYEDDTPLKCDVKDKRGNHCPGLVKHIFNDDGKEVKLCHLCYLSVLQGTYGDRLKKLVEAQSPDPSLSVSNYICPECGAEMNVREVKTQATVQTAVEKAYVTASAQLGLAMVALRKVVNRRHFNHNDWADAENMASYARDAIDDISALDPVASTKVP
jgi:hypothetical protein